MAVDIKRQEAHPTLWGLGRGRGVSEACSNEIPMPSSSFAVRSGQDAGGIEENYLHADAGVFISKLLQL